MILSVSRRTDIPSFHMQWFVNRLNEGFLYVRNPVFPSKVSKISLTKEEIEFIVFWTKNPGSFKKWVNYFESYSYYLQISINDYPNHLEANLPILEQRIINFVELSLLIGAEKLVWRYDPILFTDKIDCEYHLRKFAFLCSKLTTYTDTVMISLIDEYPKMLKQVPNYVSYDFTSSEGIEFLRKLARIAKDNNLRILTCSESIDLSSIGILPGKCIDDNRIAKILRKEIIVKKDRGQRKECSCVESIDVGSYNTCLHGCSYCYANYSEESIKRNLEKLDVDSPMLSDSIRETDAIIERKLKKVIVPFSQKSLNL